MIGQSAQYGLLFDAYVLVELQCTVFNVKQRRQRGSYKYIFNVAPCNGCFSITTRAHATARADRRNCVERY